MKKLIKLTQLFIVGLAISLIATQQAFTKEIYAHAGDYPPFFIAEDNSDNINKSYSGIIPDIMNLFMQKHPEFTIVYKSYPDARARAMGEHGEKGIDIHFRSTTFVNEAFLRHNPYAGTFARTDDIVVTLASSDLIYKEPSDLYGLEIGTIIGYGYSDFETLFESGKVINEPVSTHEANIKKLLSGRIDAFFGNVHVSPYFMVQMGLDPSQFRFADVSLFGFDYGPLITTREPELFNAMSSFLKQIQATGELEAIINQYLE